MLQIQFTQIREDFSHISDAFAFIAVRLSNTNKRMNLVEYCEKHPQSLSVAFEMFVLQALVFVSLCFVVNFLKKWKSMKSLADKIPGLDGLPIMGMIHKFIAVEGKGRANDVKL
jgi:hypothetical protein